METEERYCRYWDITKFLMPRKFFNQNPSLRSIVIGRREIIALMLTALNKLERIF